MNKTLYMKPCSAEGAEPHSTQNLAPETIWKPSQVRIPVNFALKKELDHPRPLQHSTQTFHATWEWNELEINKFIESKPKRDALLPNIAFQPRGDALRKDTRKDVPGILVRISERPSLVSLRMSTSKVSIPIFLALEKNRLPPKHYEQTSHAKWVWNELEINKYIVSRPGGGDGLLPSAAFQAVMMHCVRIPERLSPVSLSGYQKGRSWYPRA